MITFLAVLRNNLYRLVEHKARIYLSLALTVGAVTAALILNHTDKPIGRIAVISENPEEITSSYLQITSLETTPPLSALFLGRYDAVAAYSQTDGYEIKTIKNQQFEKTLQEIIEDPLGYVPDNTHVRQIGTSIIGFLTMFLLLQGISAMDFFAQDKEQKQIRRIACSPISLAGYLLGHGVFTFLFLLLPTIGILCSMKYFFRISIGLGIGEYMLLLSVLCILAAAFALFLNALIKSGASVNMIGSSVVILTSILAGSFYSFEENSQVLSVLANMLPQKICLTSAALLEKGSGLQAALPYLQILIFLSLLFFVMAAWKINKEYGVVNKRS